MRQLKHHEQKLLKKVDFLRWKNEDNLRELQVYVCSSHLAALKDCLPQYVSLTMKAHDCTGLILGC